MKDQLTVVHVTNQLGVGGTQKALEVLVRQLDETAFNVSVCGYKDGGKRGQELEADGYTVKVAGSPAKFADVLRESDVDILHMHGMYDTTTEVVDIAKNIGVPVLIRTTPFGRVSEGTQNNIDLHLFPSKMTLLRHLKLGGQNMGGGDWNQSVRLLYYPLSENDVSSRHTSDLREELGIGPDTPVVGKIGRSSAAKWSDIAIEAFEKVCNEYPETRVLLVTPPEKIRNAISQRDIDTNVVYLDPIQPSDVGEFYNTIDVLAHSSAIGESFGYVIAEAMAYGTPVVVDSNPMRDNAQVELVNNGETGFVVGSTTAYAEATLNLLRSEERRLEFGAAAQQRAMSLFHPEPLVDELETLYRVLYETDGDTAAIIDELGAQYEVMAEFESEYQIRLQDLYGSVSAFHQFERGVWRLCSDVIPAYRNAAYQGLQGLFKDI